MRQRMQKSHLPATSLCEWVHLHVLLTTTTDYHRLLTSEYFNIYERHSVDDRLRTLFAGMQGLFVPDRTSAHIPCARSILIAQVLLMRFIFKYRLTRQPSVFIRITRGKYSSTWLQPERYKGNHRIRRSDWLCLVSHSPTVAQLIGGTFGMIGLPMIANV